MTRRSIAQPAGRSSQFGEGTYRAPPASPPAEMAVGERGLPFPFPLFPVPFTDSALGVQLFLDTEALHAVAQRAEGDAEQFRRGGAVVVRLLERIEDRLALDRVQLLRQRPSGEGGRGPRRGRRRNARGGDLQILGA